MGKKVIIRKMRNGRLEEEGKEGRLGRKEITIRFVRKEGFLD